MDIDPDIANWVLEYLLRQPLEDGTLNSLLRFVPLPNDKPNLKKSLLLKKLESDISHNPISETTLELLEQLEEIESQRGNVRVSDTMKQAYCAAAVDCTVRILKAGDDGEKVKKSHFFEAVKRVWRRRIGRMKRSVEKGGLGSEPLWAWKGEMEAAVWDDDISESVVKESEGVNAVETVNAYIREEREKMGPSFLELVAERVKSDKDLQGILGVGGDDQEAGEEAPPAGIDRVVNGCNDGKEIHKGKIKLRDKLVGLKHSRALASRNTRGVKIVDSNEMTNGPSNIECNLPGSAEVNKVREALDLSSLELRAVVKDPLPDALRLAEAISDEARNNKHQNLAEDNHVKANSVVGDEAGVAQTTIGGMRNVAKPSLMERNSSACTYEWDDSIDKSQEDPACQGRVWLPSPRKINTSPLHRYEIKNLKRRRKGRKWSLQEEDALRAGVEKYGKGNWKVILNLNRDAFEGRTEVDLKDKWRNLTRY